ncbi:hypothetical protein [Candidatus Accumulibacter sp. ACC007]|uniref:hypothetical protein n=1 Tax=Candidatus Accumulibacter sp. ACC007 TaxID=2823333 RepID=UPI003419F401
MGTLLAALKASGANYLITGDKDLLAMAERYPIVAPAAFWALYAGLRSLQRKGRPALTVGSRPLCIVPSYEQLAHRNG